MKYVYMDNFRGFNDSLILLDDVNFCVGENSSGKTSFLNIINYIASANIWLEGVLSNEESGLSHFEDMVSLNSDNSDKFSIGFSYLGEQPNESDVSSTLFTLTNNEGEATVQTVTHFNGKATIRFEFAKKLIKYWVLSDSDISQNKIEKGLFSKWKKVHDDMPQDRYMVIKKGGFHFSSFSPYGALVEIRYDLYSRDKEARKKNEYHNQIMGVDLVWLAPIRTEPKRTYDEVGKRYSSTGQHTPYVLKKHLSNTKKNRSFINSLNKFGADSGLFKEIRVKKHGVSKTAPFELDVILGNKPLNIRNVGYGVSQSLPVIVELLTRDKGTWYAIQQPEVHLHPKAQASFGEVIFQLSLNENKHFIVETHSDFTIDRFRTTLRKSKEKVSCSVLYFERKKGQNKAYRIEIDSNGDFVGKIPNGYRNFFLKEELSILGMD